MSEWSKERLEKEFPEAVAQFVSAVQKNHIAGYTEDEVLKEFTKKQFETHVHKMNELVQKADKASYNQEARDSLGKALFIIMRDTKVVMGEEYYQPSEKRDDKIEQLKQEVFLAKKGISFPGSGEGKAL